MNVGLLKPLHRWVKRKTCEKASTSAHKWYEVVCSANKVPLHTKPYSFALEPQILDPVM